jgi:type I restriction enzyme S subunit
MAKTYESYKDSGIAWIGEIPSEWKMVDAKRILKNEKKVVGKESENYDRLALTLNGVIKRSKDDSEGLQPEKFESYQILGINDLVFKLIDLQNISTSRVGLSPYEGLVSPAYIVVKNRKGNDNKFYYYWYMNMYYTHVFNNIGGDGVRSAINAQDLLSLKIPNISLDKQRAIASFLDTKCGEIDSLISLQEEMISELQAYKQSVITEAVTKGLDPNAKMNCCASREKNDACISSSETQPAIERKFKDSGVEWIGEIPEHWEVRRIKNIGDSKNGLTYSPADVVDENEGTLVLRSSNIQNGRLCFDDNVYVSRQVPNNLWVNKGDIIICSRNGSAALVGKCAMVEDDIKATFGAFMMRFQSVYYHKYIYYLLTCAISQYKQLFSTTTINQLTVGVFDGLAMPFIDDRDEQQQIASYLDAKTSQIDSLISLKQQKIDELKSYKKSIIYEYVTGKKRV